MIEADDLIESDFSISWMQETLLDDLDAGYAAMTVPLLYIQVGDDPLFSSDQAGAVMTLFATTDQQLETLPGTDYLSVVDVAAGPIVQWLASR